MKKLCHLNSHLLYAEKPHSGKKILNCKPASSFTCGGNLKSTRGPQNKQQRAAGKHRNLNN